PDLSSADLQPPPHPRPPRTPRHQSPRDHALGAGPYRRSPGHARLHRPPRPAPLQVRPPGPPGPGQAAVWCDATNASGPASWCTWRSTSSATSPTEEGSERWDDPSGARTAPKPATPTSTTLSTTTPV